MKKLIISCIVILFLFACAGGNFLTTAPCIVDKTDGAQIEFGQYCAEVQATNQVSFICNLKTEKNLDACYLHRTLEIVSVSGVVLETYTIEEFESWANYLKDALNAGMSYNTLRLFILDKFADMNKKAGATILILGNMFLQLPQAEIIPRADIELINSSIDDLVNDMKVIYGME